MTDLLYKKFGAPRQNRTAITGLQNQCNAIILVGRVCYSVTLATACVRVLRVNAR